MTASNADAYGLRPPVLEDARDAVARVSGDDAAVWSALLLDAGLTGLETGPDAVARLVEVMHGGSPALRLCARALTVRATAFEHLAAASDVLRSTR